MQLPSFRDAGPALRVMAVAALCASLPFPAAAQAAPATMAKAKAEAEASAEPIPDNRQRVSLYTVINLGPDSFTAELNERGQAAFTTDNYFGTVSRFFDGERIRPIGSLGGNFSWVRALNNHGVVVGQSSTGGQPDRLLGFVWSPAAGMRALPGESATIANDINDRNEIVGVTPAPGAGARAVRWNPDVSVTPLGPLPQSLSEASAINNRGYATGSANVAYGGLRATLWDPAGGETDLGPPNRSTSYGLHINERNEVAGQISYTRGGRPFGFFWSRDSGTVPIGTWSASLADLNNRGEVVGTTYVVARAFQWSLGQGQVWLPLPSGGFSTANDINNHGETVGTFQPYEVEPGERRALRWPSSVAQPIDLNTRLFRAAAGLVLRDAVAINDNGVILANSNAGLVMLRPGRHGTDAPVLGPIAGLPTAASLGQEVTLTVDFTDNAAAQTHTASVLVTDGCPSTAPTVTEAGGVGQVRLQHRFCAAGDHAVKVVVTDSGGRATELQRDVFVQSPALAALSGEGTLAAGAAPAAGGHPDAPLRFTLWAPLGGSASIAVGAGRPVVRFSGPFQFRSAQVASAAAAGGLTRVEGTGRLNGRDGYRFVLEAVDGAAAQAPGADRLRVRVSHADAASRAEVVDYDNGAAAQADGADRTAVVAGGLTLSH
jgi:hypothetical protein